jgi:regulator of protease activity HflC (stomatin/prohibitin superfamily)
MTLMTNMFDWALGLTRVLVSENERVLALHKGRFVGILGPGEYRLPNRDGTLVAERHDLNSPALVSKFERALLRERADLAAQHLTVLEAEDGEVAVLMREGALHAVARGGKERGIYWTDAGPWQIKRFALTGRLEVPDELRAHIERGGWAQVVVKATVEPGQVGLLTIGGVYLGTLDPGVHLFWNLGRNVAVKLVDTRWKVSEVNGQEVLTADRVTIRVNIAANYRVTDPVKAASTVDDFAEALHRALQFAFRKTLGVRTLDQMLAEKVSVDAEAADKVRAEMAEIGIEVGEIALKDVILPGEMREILNRVVAAEKEAEANVIRRREETAATRSLLNTAKVMAEHPVMLRLKELEALDAIAGKVKNLTVLNGTEGLMKGLVRLSD